MINPIFLCHGGPSIVMEDNSYIDFLKQYASNCKPKAIIIFSAHWEEEVTTISSNDGVYDTIYDFYGFPEELYRMKYPAKGSKKLAQEIKEKLSFAGIDSRLNTIRGLDHGAWDILYLMFPKADIPVVEVSINPFLPKENQIQIGEAIKDFAKEDILIIGSGSCVHNLRTVDWDATKPKEWAIEFDDWLVNKVTKKDIEALIHYQDIAPYAKKAIPREEHIVPLFIALGSGSLANPKLLHRSYIYGTLSYIGFEF